MHIDERYVKYFGHIRRGVQKNLTDMSANVGGGGKPSSVLKLMNMQRHFLTFLGVY